MTLLTEFCGGLATVCDRQGKILDISSGLDNEHDDYERFITECITEIKNELISIRTKRGITFVFIVFAKIILVLDNRNRLEEKEKYLQIIEEALPFIAQVAGGAAVLFDNKGIRLRAFQPDGKEDVQAEGVFNQLTQCVMQELRPSIGPSTLNPGSTAVRIPLTPEYGLAFNNTHATNQRQRLLDNVRQYRYASYQLEDIIGESLPMARAKKLAGKVAKSQTTVLITGETGTGKELFAQAIHNLSLRYNQPFVAINCGALPSELVESILFGHAEGAFTGARKGGQAGAFEQANQGTLFLDEVSEMPIHLQVKLLRVLQECEVTRVGDSKPVKIDVRIIASTNKVLPEMIKAGKFREDLYFRLNVFELIIPPLRDRHGDLIALTDFMLKKYSNMLGKKVDEITPEAMRELMRYSWPGNVRELQNCLEYALHMVDMRYSSITADCLPAYIKKSKTVSKQALSLFAEQMNTLEKDIIVNALAICGDNKAEAARKLGISRTTMWRIIKKYRLDDKTVSR